MFGKRREDRVSANFMDRIYVHNLDCPFEKKKDGTIVVDMEHKGFFSFVAQKEFGKPRISHIVLDEYGSTLWEAIDGKNTVWDAVRVMEEAFPDEKKDMLKRVVTFFRTLESNGFIFHRP